MTKLATKEIAALDPYTFMAVIGKRVIHPGGRSSTESLLARAAINEQSRVLDVGCGVATTAIAIARRHRVHVSAVDISPLMLERAEANVRASGATAYVNVARGDVLDLHFDAATFDVVIAEAVTMFVDRRRAAAELARVAKPGRAGDGHRVLLAAPTIGGGPGGLPGPGLPRPRVRHGRGLGADL
jgi:SAM-dependent methyltransferase